MEINLLETANHLYTRVIEIRQLRLDNKVGTSGFDYDFIALDKNGSVLLIEKVFDDYLSKLEINKKYFGDNGLELYYDEIIIHMLKKINERDATMAHMAEEREFADYKRLKNKYEGE